VVVSPAPITHITDFNHNSFIDFSSSLVVQLLILFFHFFDRLASRGFYSGGGLIISDLKFSQFTQNIFVFLALLFSPDINVNIINFLVIYIREITFDASILVYRGLNLRILLPFSLLPSLPLQLFPQVFLLLGC
jgi:hypothetical protein